LLVFLNDNDNNNDNGNDNENNVYLSEMSDNAQVTLQVNMKK